MGIRISNFTAVDSPTVLCSEDNMHFWHRACNMLCPIYNVRHGSADYEAETNLLQPLLASLS